MLTSSKRLWLDRWQAFCRYYPHLRFALIDLSFGLIALFSNPYRVCRKFLQKKGQQEVHVYGETPFATYERIIGQCEIRPTDVWIEMGSGRGKGCFWLALFSRCRVIGIEWIPQFVQAAKALQFLFRVKGLEFYALSVEKADLSKATVIYLYGIWPQIEVPFGIKVITISEPLEGFTVLKKFWVRYPWGRTTAFLQIKTNPSF